MSWRQHSRPEEPRDATSHSGVQPPRNTQVIPLTTAPRLKRSFGSRKWLLASSYPSLPTKKSSGVVPFISLAKRQRECLILHLKFLVPTASVPSSQRTLNGYLKSFCETETEQRQQGGKDSKLKEWFEIHSLIYSILLAFFFTPTKSRSAHRNISTGGKWYNVPTLCSNPNHSNQLHGSR